jgi:hypothetical protein
MARGASPSAKPASRPASGTSSTVDRRSSPVDRDDPNVEPRTSNVEPRTSNGESGPVSLKDAFLARVRQDKKFFYGTVVAQAHRIDVHGDEIRFTFAPAHRALRAQFEQNRPWLEGLAEAVAGRRVTVASTEAAITAPAEASGGAPADADAKAAELRARAMENEGVQALLDVFGAEIKTIEEMEP